MKKVKLLGAMMAMMIASASFAQDFGVEFFMTDQLDKAKDIFETHLKNGNNVAEANYYLGEIAYEQGNTEQAKTYYEAGLAADPLYSLNKIGLAKFLIKSDVKLGTKELKDIAKVEKKNPTALVAIAQVYQENGLKEDMEKTLSQAEKADKKTPLVYIFRGNLLSEVGNVGGAAEQYEQATFKNDQYVVPYVKIADIYVAANINAQLAIEKLNAALEINADYAALTNRYMARAYYNIGQYAKAIEIQAKSFDINISSVQDLTDYAASLFFSERYDEAASLIDKGFQREPNNFILNRLRLYIALEMSDFENGLAIGEKFFTLPKGKNKYIPRDYATYGSLFVSNKRIDKAKEQYDIAIKESNAAEKNSEKLKDNEYDQLIFDKLNKEKYTGVAADYYGEYMKVLSDNDAASLVHSLAQVNYLYKAANKATNIELQNPTLDSVQVAKQAAERLIIADSICGGVIEKVPDNVTALLWRARINTALDPETSTGQAKPYYEALLTVVLTKDEAAVKYKRELLEIYRYLSYYYYLQYEAKKENTKSKESDRLADREQIVNYCNKMIELQPTNAIATQLLQALEAEEQAKIAAQKAAAKKAAKAK
ncbi:hypothetical protein AGMMS4956_08880 [Bacteroidia bacterium]|nr:hypothetical protein AGMMS4956_08880 [Bacteroidia bacterium]